MATFELDQLVRHPDLGELRVYYVPQEDEDSWWLYDPEAEEKYPVPIRVENPELLEAV